MRRLPIGISDYRKVIEEGYSYIDKTLFIEDVLLLGTEVILIPRPRRFGKTINLSMLKYFFERADQDLSSLFQGFKIWKTEHRKEQGKYPVIFLSLKGIKNSTWEDAFEDLKLLISAEFERHQVLLTALFPDPLPEGKKTGDPLLSDGEKKLFHLILNRQGDKLIFKNSLKMLTLWLNRYYQKKAIVLIDEYDTPIHAAYLNSFYDSMIEFMRGWLGEGLKDNPHLEKAVLTGILRVAKESVFLGLNNLGCYTVLDEQFADKFGLLEEEVSSLLKEYNIVRQTEEIRSWYNGYRIGHCSLYNPWSILECIQREGDLRPYWVGTSDNELIKRLLIQGSPSMKQDMEKLLIGESVVKPIDEAISFRDLHTNSNTVFALFLFSGYLTLNKKPIYQNKALQCELKIPNKEIKDLYESMITEWITSSIPNRNLSALLESLTTGNIEVFTELFQSIVIKSMSFYDVIEDEPEMVYHAFVLGLLVTLEETHEVKSNRESGFGRYDVCVIPKDRSSLGIIIEFKKVKAEKDLDNGALDALAQIENKNYVAEMQGLKIKNILLLGIAFQGKRIAIKEKSV